MHPHVRIRVRFTSAVVAAMIGMSAAMAQVQTQINGPHIITSGPGMGTQVNIVGGRIVDPVAGHNGVVGGPEPVTPMGGCNNFHYHGTLGGAADPNRNGCGWGELAPFFGPQPNPGPMPGPNPNNNPPFQQPVNRPTLLEQLGLTYGGPDGGAAGLAGDGHGATAPAPGVLKTAAAINAFTGGMPGQTTSVLTRKEERELAAQFAVLLDPTVKKEDMDEAYRQTLAHIEAQDADRDAAAIERERQAVIDEARARQIKADEKAARDARLAQLQRESGVRQVKTYIRQGTYDIEGRDLGPVRIQRHQKEALFLLRTARVAELVQALMQLNLIKRSDGKDTDKGITGSNPAAALTELDRLNQRIISLQRQGASAEAIDPLKQQRDALLEVNGVASNEQLAQARQNLLNYLSPRARSILELWNRWQAASAKLAEAQAAMKRYTDSISPSAGYGGAEVGRSIAAALQPLGEAVRAARTEADNARRAYLQSLEGNALLNAQVSIPGFEGTFWRALSELTDPAKVQAALDSAIANTEQTLTNEITRIGTMHDAEELFKEFGTPLYAPLRQSVGRQIAGVVPYMPAAMESVASAYQAFQTDEEFWRQVNDAVITGAQVLVGSVIVLFPPSALVLGPVELALVGGQVALEGYRTYTAWSDLGRAEQAAAAGGGTSLAGITEYEQVLSSQQVTLVFTIALAPLDVAGTASSMRAAQALRQTRTVRTAAGIVEVTDEVLDAGRAAVKATDNPRGVLGRLDSDHLAGYGRYGEPGDPSFFRRQGLEPKVTVDIDGYTYHLSDPFEGPGGRIGVIAFQEAGDGKVIPRTFYLSNEHGTWRAATAADGELIHKGVQQIRTTAPDGTVRIYNSPEELPELMGFERFFPNEMVADLDGRLQAMLGAWTTQRGVKTLDGEAAQRAFFGHLEQPEFPGMPGREFGAYTEAADVLHPLPPLDTPGLLPDLSKGPAARWPIPEQHQFYGGGEGFLFPSADGNTWFIVIRDKDGHVFVPSVQNADVSLTPFGTRIQADVTDLTTTPYAKPAGRYELVGYENDLTRFFADGLDNALNAAPPSTLGLPLSPAPRTGNGLATTMLPLNPVFRYSAQPYVSDPLGINDAVNQSDTASTPVPQRFAAGKQ